MEEEGFYLAAGPKLNYIGSQPASQPASSSVKRTKKMWQGNYESKRGRNSFQRKFAKFRN